MQPGPSKICLWHPTRGPTEKKKEERVRRKVTLENGAKKTVKSKKQEKSKIFF
jgi:hypothetical protein